MWAGVVSVFTFFFSLSVNEHVLLIQEWRQKGGGVRA